MNRLTRLAKQDKTISDVMAFLLILFLHTFWLYTYFVHIVHCTCYFPWELYCTVMYDILEQGTLGEALL